MKVFDLDRGYQPVVPQEVRAATIENPTVPVSASNFLQFFGIDVDGVGLPVTIDQAFSVPAYACGVTFLSRCLANLPLHAYRVAGDNQTPSRLGGSLQRMLNEAPNSEWTSFGLRQYFWQSIFTAGRGLIYVEKTAAGPSGMWPLNPFATSVQRSGGRKFYQSEGKTYSASEIIDVPFMLKADGLGVYSPLALLGDTLRLAINMRAYASGFFKGGGVPPLALIGPMPSGPDAVKRAQQQVARSIKSANERGESVFPIPVGHELKPVGFDPEKGMMVEALRFVIEEIARGLNLPPVFLQDLTHGTYSNTDQQDLTLSKHVVAPWSKALEDEVNLKFFGPVNNRRYVEHSLDGLMRGDPMNRIQALAQAVQNGLRTPDEARSLDNLGPVAGGNRAYIQGATVPLESAGAIGHATASTPGPLTDAGKYVHGLLTDLAAKGDKDAIAHLVALGYEPPHSDGAKDDA